MSSLGSIGGNAGMRSRVQCMVMLLASLLSACGGGDGTTGLAAGTVASAGTNGNAGNVAGGGGNPLALRALPAIYSSTSTLAINYSPYRAAGPGAETPSDAQISTDLGLLSSAGFTLLRLFGADPVSESVLRVAATSYPNLKFQQGIYLFGIALGASQSTCSNSNNDAQVATGIRLANTYSNVVAVSVGNETSFFSQYMPMTCLKGYITTVKQGVTQPVTADDDYTFYTGSQLNKPDTILPLLDFVSIHLYPFSNQGQWTGAGTSASAAALMNGALAAAQQNYTQAAAYIGSHGGAGLPVTIGETGWKATPTNPGLTSSSGGTCPPLPAGNALEGTGSCSNSVITLASTKAATPDNAHWYYDLLNQWTTTSSGTTAPKVVFYFEAFDESWKTTDDGWGFWDKNRVPRVTLCSLAGARSTVASCPANGTYPGASAYP